MDFCAVKLVDGSCNIAGVCRFNHDIEKSNLRRKKHVTSLKKTRDTQICYKELAVKDSCPFGQEKCRFSHDFPESLRNDEAFIQKSRKEAMKQSLCVNEYVCKGGCYKKQRCRFNHDITDDQRQDPDIQVKMKAKLEKLSNKDTRGEQEKKDDTNSMTNISKEIEDLRKMVLEIKGKRF